MSTIQTTQATHMGAMVSPKPQSQESRDQARTADAQRLAGAPETEKGPVSAGALHAAAARVKQVVEAASGSRLNFEIYEDTQQLYVQVKDSESGEVVKTIPPESLMDLQKRLDELIGMIFDAKG